ncbi:class F sortase [Streptomyces sp. RKAG290]|uniref:class F sortase n=1 Tax=Streptomyces sp. RKAG290 TaxID=2888348 RepID=UPI0020335B59|nr:class F sortase [Streptomyces sp. RKAG290]MCM2412190.1 class F sortase [Streptomyces sp. RKAG290]
MHTSFTRRLTAASLVTLSAVAVLTGCASGDDAPATPPAHIATSPARPAPTGAATPMPASEPVRVRIPSAGVDTGPVLDLGLAADGTVEVPTVVQADRIGWYTKGVTPGERGPAVLIGHFDTAEGPAVLKNVAKIRVGDRITVTRADGSDAVFAVRRLQQVDKGAFPTDEVYGDTAGPELRLITCGGDLKGGHRPDNIIAFANLVR